MSESIKHSSSVADAFHNVMQALRSLLHRTNPNDRNGYVRNNQNNHMPSPEHVHESPIHDIVLDVTLEQIPVGPECLACGEIMHKAYVSYSFGSKLIIRAQKTAGYRCASCDLISYSPEAILDAQEQGLPLLREVENPDVIREMEQSIELKREIVAHRTLETPR